jgi:hypothetical protein
MYQKGSLFNFLSVLSVQCRPVLKNVLKYFKFLGRVTSVLEIRLRNRRTCECVQNNMYYTDEFLNSNFCRLWPYESINYEYNEGRKIHFRNTCTPN